MTYWCRPHFGENMSCMLVASVPRTILLRLHHHQYYHLVHSIVYYPKSYRDDQRAPQEIHFWYHKNSLWYQEENSLVSRRRFNVIIDSEGVIRAEA